jgi:hypothetical protein
MKACQSAHIYPSISTILASGARAIGLTAIVFWHRVLLLYVSDSLVLGGCIVEGAAAY